MRTAHRIASIVLTLATAVSAAEPGRTVEAQQKTPPKYKPMPTRLLEDLPAFTPAATPERSPFGGDTTSPKLKATGFFRAEKVGDRWWLVDPQGYRTINVAVVSTNVGPMTPQTQQAFDKKFGSKEGWAEKTRQFLRDAGFDGTGNWSDDETLSVGTDRRLVRTPSCSFMGQYGTSRGGTHAEPGHLGYPDKCIFTFDPEFAAFADKIAAEKIAPSKDDPYLLGWFTDNELPFPLDSLDRYLKLPAGDHGRDAAEAFVRQRGTKPEALTDDDRQAWTAVVAEKYFSVVHAAVRKADPNHLILGPRFHSTDHRNAALLTVAGKYMDVVGYNVYNVWSPAEMMTRIAGYSGRPVLVTEFYAKAEDSGLANQDGAGWLVHTQADRAAFYENFTLGLLQSRVCVGWQWFKYIDNDPAFAKPPLSNDSNKGILNRMYEPYAPLLTSMKRVNPSRYALADYFDRHK